MRKLCASIIAIMSCLIMTVSASETALAADASSVSTYNTTSTTSDYLGPVNVGNQYVDLVRKQGGINRKVFVQTYSIWYLHHLDVRMLDRYGNVVWEEYGAIDAGGSRTFTVGSNVVAVQARVASKNIFGEVQPEKGICEVTLE